MYNRSVLKLSKQSFVNWNRRILESSTFPEKSLDGLGHSHGFLTWGLRYVGAPIIWLRLPIGLLWVLVHKIADRISSFADGVSGFLDQTAKEWHSFRDRVLDRWIVAIWVVILSWKNVEKLEFDQLILNKLVKIRIEHFQARSYLI